MQGPGADMPKDRLGHRVRVDRPAEIVYFVPSNRRRKPPVEVRVPVTVYDVSVTGAALLLASDPPQLGRSFGLIIDGYCGTVHARWRHAPSEPNAPVVYGVQFADPRPPFLPTIYEWLDRAKEIGNAKMID
jgi:hypothetical protein